MCLNYFRTSPWFETKYWRVDRFEICLVIKFQFENNLCLKANSDNQGISRNSFVFLVFPFASIVSLQSKTLLWNVYIIYSALFTPSSRLHFSLASQSSHSPFSSLDSRKLTHFKGLWFTQSRSFFIAFRREWDGGLVSGWRRLFCWILDSFSPSKKK